MADQEWEETDSSAWRLGLRARDLVARVQRRGSELAAVRGDAIAQMRVNAAAEAETRTLRQTLAELDNAARADRQRGESEMEELRTDLAETQDDIRNLARQQRERATEVDRKFAALHTEIRQGLQDVERQRLQMEVRLDKEIAALDDKIEADRLDREQRNRIAIERATARISAVNELLREERDLGDLHLSLEEDAIKNKLDRAETLILSKDAQAALSTSANVFSEFQALRSEARRRRLAIHEARDALRNSAEVIRTRLQEPNIVKFFARERRRLERLLEDIMAMAVAELTKYRSLEEIKERVSEALSNIDRITVTMERAVDQVDSLLTLRAKRCREVDEQLLRRHGMPSARQTTLVDPQDLKSSMIVKYRFGGCKVDVIMEMEASRCIVRYRIGQAAEENYRDEIVDFNKGIPVSSGDVLDSVQTDTDIAKVNLSNKQTAWRYLDGEIKKIEKFLR